MSAKSLAEKPTWLESLVIDPKRFDTGYYDPSLTIAERNLREQKHVKWKRMREIGRVYNFGAYELTNRIRFVDKSCPQAIPFITVTNIGELTVDFESAPWIDQDSHRLLEASICRPGTVLVSIAGTIGRAGVLPANFSEYNANQAIAKIEVDANESDPHFLAAYLSTTVGLAASQREAAGAVQKNLYIYNVEEIPVPCPPRQICEAIGNKVRAAEKLKCESVVAKQKIQRWLDESLPSWEEPGERLAVSPTFVSGFEPERLDAWYNHAQFRSLEGELSERPSLVALSTICEVVSDRWKCATHQIEYIEIGEFDLTQGIVNGNVIASADAPSRAQIAALPGDLAVSLVRPNRKNIVFIQGSGKVPIVVTSGCEVLRFRSVDMAALYSVILRHNTIAHQIMRWNTGTSYPAIEKLRVERVFVPSIPAARETELLEAARLSVLGGERANELVRSAIKDVELLMNGMLDQAFCVEEGLSLAKEFRLESNK